MDISQVQVEHPVTGENTSIQVALHAASDLKDCPEAVGELLVQAANVIRVLLDPTSIEIKISVGEHEPKQVSPLNNKLYLEAKQHLEENQHKAHIGWSGVSSFINWLEANYTLEAK